VSDAPSDAAGAPPRATPDHFRDALEAALTPSYALGRELGGGGMSRVFLAEERALGRTVVVKVLPPDLAAGINRDRFRREIQLAARLQHPHIVPLLAAGEVEGTFYYTMPYIQGESVRAALARGRRFSVRDVVRLLHDVVDALAHAHARGIVHRDVKPGNVLLQGSHALVTDFGVAKALSAARGGTSGGEEGDAFVTVTGATSTGLAIGTPAYMAPEQLAADPSADHRVDLYAAGLLAYELCTGASPFLADSPRATLAAQLTRMPEPLHVVRPDVPPALSDVIMRCLAKEASDRPPTAEALLADLEAATQGVSLAGGERGASSGEGFAYAEPGTTPRSGATAPAVTPVSGGSAPTRPANQPVLATAPVGGPPTAPTQAMATGAERRHAWLVAGLVAGAGLALLAGVALSRARQGTPVPLPAAPAPTTAAAPAGPPTPAAVPAPPPTAAAPAPARPPALTRDDSLAIAAAVERRLAAEASARRQAEERPMAPAELEAIRAEAWKRYGDSVRGELERQFGPDFGRTMAQLGAAGAAQARIPQPRSPLPPNAPPGPMTPGAGARVFVVPPVGAAAAAAAAAALAADPNVARLAARTPRPKAGVRRVAVLDLSDATGRPELRGAVQQASDGLRRAIAAMPGHDVPDAGATRELARLGLPLQATGLATHAGAVVSGSVGLRRDSTAQLVLLVYDVERGYPRSVRATAPVRPGDDPGAVAAALLDAVSEPLAAALDRVKWKDPKDDAARQGDGKSPSIER
jgi:serine/threonine-protein kinase